MRGTERRRASDPVRHDASFEVHFGGQVHGWDPVARFGAKEARHLDRFAQFAMAASISAVDDSGIDFSQYVPRMPAASSSAPASAG